MLREGGGLRGTVEREGRGRGILARCIVLIFQGEKESEEKIVKASQRLGKEGRRWEDVVFWCLNVPFCSQGDEGLVRRKWGHRSHLPLLL